MERRSDLGQPFTSPNPGLSGRRVYNTDPEDLPKETGALIGEPPRVFALLQESKEGNKGVIAEVVAYGLALPGGTATTVGPNGRGFGLWTSAHSAARRLHSDLVWFGDGGTGKSAR